jgi:hypothetical protein
MSRFQNLTMQNYESSGFRLHRFYRYIMPLIDEVIKTKKLCSILDIGGVQSYWSDLIESKSVKITTVNIYHAPTTGDPKFVSLIGDARDLHQFGDNSFDLVHSNSVIEHVGRWADMKAMAKEVRRLSPAYYVQTPNFWFPIDPHSRTPFIHWLPINLRRSLHSRFDLGFYEKASEFDDAMRSTEDAVMLDAKQMESLFPDAVHIREKVLGFTKSLVAIRKSHYLSDIRQMDGSSAYVGG